MATYEDFRKYDLAELRESANSYKSWIEQINWFYSADAIARLGSESQPVPTKAADAVAKFHNAIGNIDRDAVVAWLKKFDYINEDPIECVESTETALVNLRKTISGKGCLLIARRIDSNLNNTRRYCADMANWLGQLLPILKERRRAAYAAPTDAEKEMLKDLLEWDIEEWLEEYFYLDADLSPDQKKRILRLALATDGIDEHKRERLNHVLAQVEEDTTMAHQVEVQANENSNVTENGQAEDSNPIEEEGQAEEKNDSIDGEEQALIQEDAKERMKTLLIKAGVRPPERIERFIAEPQIEEPKDVALAYFFELKLKGTGTTLKDFVECCIDLVGKRKVPAWNYNNIKTKDKRKQP